MDYRLTLAQNIDSIKRMLALNPNGPGASQAAEQLCDLMSWLFMDIDSLNKQVQSLNERFATLEEWARQQDKEE